jgi:hypothetical protein
MEAIEQLEWDFYCAVGIATLFAGRKVTVTVVVILNKAKWNKLFFRYF